MVQRTRRTEAYLLLALAIAVNAIILYGFIVRPVLAYNLSTPLEYNSTIDFNIEVLPVTLHARNQGGSPSSLDFAVRIYNMTYVDPEGASITPFQDFTMVTIPLEGSIKASMEAEKTITVSNNGDADYLVMIFSLRTRRSFNPITGFFGSFEVQKPERPTALLLKRIEPGVYQRVTQR